MTDLEKRYREAESETEKALRNAEENQFLVSFTFFIMGAMAVFAFYLLATF